MSSLPDFSLGYLDGSQQAKVWLYITEDLTAMYRKYPKGGAINLWCERNYDLADGGGNKRKRGDAAEQSSHRKAKEDENESIFKDLHEKHSGKYDTPRLRLWSRMIAAGIHDDYDEPPDIPAFSKSKRARKETVMDSISGAAVAIVEALQDKGKTTGTSAAPVSTGMSPGKCIDLRMKNFEQLRYLQSLLDDGILSEAQYAEQKRSMSTGMSPGKCIDLRMKNFEQLRYLQSLLDDGILSEAQYAEQKRSILDILNKLNK